MLSRANAKYIKSLQVKKYRKQEQCFVVEGAKSVTELLQSDFEIVQVLGTASFLSGLTYPGATPRIEVTEKELEALGGFQSNNTALAVARIKPNRELIIDETEFALVLDDIRDPGNLGTIIRTADWFGIHKVVASEETADLYNAKVISATMGSFTRVAVWYTNLEDWLGQRRRPVFGAYLGGEDVHEVAFGAGGLIVIGNESHGISSHLERFITNKVTIPRYGQAESLNAAIATAVILDNVRRSVGNHPA